MQTDKRPDKTDNPIDLSVDSGPGRLIAGWQDVTHLRLVSVDKLTNPRAYLIVVTDEPSKPPPP